MAMKKKARRKVSPRGKSVRTSARKKTSKSRPLRAAKRAGSKKPKIVKAAAKRARRAKPKTVKAAAKRVMVSAGRTARALARAGAERAVSAGRRVVAQGVRSAAKGAQVVAEGAGNVTSSALESIAERVEPEEQA
jgi:hypothetical protein